MFTFELSKETATNVVYLVRPRLICDILSTNSHVKNNAGTLIFHGTLLLKRPSFSPADCR